MTFFQAVNICFRKYTNFGGRALRSEYWYWRLFELFLALFSYRLDAIFFSNKEIGSFSLFIFFFTFLPGLAVTIRRLHDVDRSGWWLLISLTGIGNFLLLYWFIIPGENKVNDYNN
jgi:uncharacterized membrane protein YhaH (DUF805 family)